MSGLALGALALALAIVALVVARPHATAGSVASAIEAGLDGPQAVECSDEPGEAWSCAVHPLRSTACGASFQSPPPPHRWLASVGGGCEESGTPYFLAVTEQGHRFVAAPATTSAGRELDANGMIMSAPLPERRAIVRVWEWFTGS